MSRTDLLKSQLQMTRMVVDGTLADVNAEQVMRTPGGKAHPIGATYAHTVMSEDFVVSSMLRGQQPLLATSFAGKTGVSEDPPTSRGDLFSWAQKVKVDAGAAPVRPGLHKATDEYVAGLTDEDLDRKIDFFEMGPTPISGVLTMLAIVHQSNHIGEISALKGIGGAKGYPI